jgi:hypothetical protein
VKIAVPAVIIVAVIAVVVASTIILRSGDGGTASSTPTADASLPKISFVFCEPLRRPADPGKIALVSGEVVYRGNSCRPDLDSAGAVLVRTKDGSEARLQPNYVTAEQAYFEADSIVWSEASAEVNGHRVVMTGRFISRQASVEKDSIGRAFAVLHFDGEGPAIFSQISKRLIGFPITVFVDGQPLQDDRGRILAPTIQSEIRDTIALNGASEHVLNEIVAAAQAGRLE